MSYRLSVFFLFISAAFCFFLFFDLFFPFTVIKPNRQPYKILTPVVKQGGELTYQIDSCKYIAVRSNVYRSFIQVPSNIEFPGIDEPNNIAVGCRKTNQTTLIPIYLPKGTYYLNLSVLYYLNFLRTINYNFTTEKFRVE